MGASRRAHRSPWHRLRRALALLLASVTLVMWFMGARSVCRSCYRLGNYIDYYLQRELLLVIAPSNAAGPAALARGISNGVAMRRFLRLQWFAPNTLIEYLEPRRLAHQPQAKWWSVAEAAQLAAELKEGAAEDARTGESRFFLWCVSVPGLKALLPHIRDTVREAIAAVLPSEIAREDVGRGDGGHLVGSAGAGGVKAGGRASAASSSRTCVVHFRVGDFTHETLRGWKPAQLRWCIASMIAATYSFATTPTRFEVLGGGLDHGCDPTRDECGQSALGLIARGLRAAYPGAEILTPRGSVDADFARMVRAPMLLIGAFGTELKVGSSFAVYAAAASHGEVRSPGCFLRFAACMPELPLGISAADERTAQPGMQMAPHWRGYAHPSCRNCRNLEVDADHWAHTMRVRDFIGTPLGRKWRAVGPRRPKQGSELAAHALRAALAAKVQAALNASSTRPSAAAATRRQSGEAGRGGGGSGGGGDRALRINLSVAELFAIGDAARAELRWDSYVHVGGGVFLRPDDSEPN